MEDDNEDIVKEFLIESYENLDQLDQELVQLEKNPTDKSLLSSIFRTIHTIKGTCGFLAFSKLESISHVGENLLSKLRDGELQYNNEIANVLLAMVDAVRQILYCLEYSRDEGDVDYSGLVELLTNLQSQEALPEAKIEKPADLPVEEPGPAPSTPEIIPGGNLYENLGKSRGVEATADIFYSRILSDNR